MSFLPLHVWFLAIEVVRDNYKLIKQNHIKLSKLRLISLFLRMSLLETQKSSLASLQALFYYIFARCNKIVYSKPNQ